MSASSIWHNLTQEPGLYVIRSAGAVVVLVAALVVGHIAHNRVRRALERTRLGPNPSLLLARLARFAIWILGLLWILAIFSVPFTALAAVVGVAALALSLSLQALLQNLIAGIYLLGERPFRIGDRVTVAGVSGVIDDIQMRVTLLHTDQGERIVMPNQTVFTDVIVNNTVLGSRAATVTLAAPRSIDTESLTSKALDAVRGVKAVAAHPPPRIEAASLAPDTGNWSIYVWLEPGADLSDVLLALSKALPEATVGLPAAT